MFRLMKLTHKSGESKVVDIFDYTVRELNNIVSFYSNHRDFTLERL
jgi:hypothetical protein